MNLLYPLTAKLAKSLARNLGFELQRRKHTAQYRLNGLLNLPIRTVLDVGANRGQFAREIHEHFPSARIHCVEPLPAAFAELHQWAQSTSPGLVTAHQVALAGSAGVAQMFEHTEHDASSSLLMTTREALTLYPALEVQQACSVKTMTMDELWQEIGPQPEPLMVKLDVQGYEREVVAGGSKTLSLAAACIVEVNLAAIYEGQATMLELLLLLSKCGLHYAGNLDQVYDGNGQVVYLDALFLRERRRA